jgi:DNA (cytosine-5)-methyltransferase 1
MKFATACSGIGVPDLAAHNLGWQSVFACEREAFPRAVLEYRFGYGKPGAAPLLDDMLTIEAADFPETECFIAGTPCQSFSIAGLRGGIKDARGNLTLKFVELCHAFQDSAAAFRWALWENVPGVLSDKGNAFGTFISALVGGNAPALPPGSEADDFTPEGQQEIKDGLRARPGSWPSAGMVSGPRARLAWRVLDAQYFGVAQRRRRVFVVVSFGAGDPAKVLFEQRSRDGNPSARRNAREGTAPTLAARTKGGGGLGTDTELDGGLIPEIVPQAISSKWAKGSSGPAGDEIANLVAFQQTTHALTGEGFDASEDGTGRGTPIIAFKARQDPDSSHIAAAIDTHGFSQAVAFAIQERAGAANPAAGPNGAGFSAEKAYTLEARQTPQSVSFTLHGTAASAAASQTDVHSALRARTPGQSENSTTTILQTGYAVRRLTPRECERLQGLPDDWTLIPTWNKKRAGWKKDLAQTVAWIMAGEIFDTEEAQAARYEEAKALAAHPDGPRYKAIGNAWAYPCGLWIMRRMDAEDRKTTA